MRCEDALTKVYKVLQAHFRKTTENRRYRTLSSNPLQVLRIVAHELQSVLG